MMTHVMEKNEAVQKVLWGVGCHFCKGDMG